MSINGELWCQHDLLVTVRSPGRLPHVIRVNQPFARVGGHPEAEVPLPDELEHQRALYLHATQEGIFCLNLDPTSGLHSTTRWLRPGRTAQVGRTVIEAVFADAPDMTERDLGDLRVACFDNGSSAHMQVRIAGQGQPVAVKHCRSPLTLVGRDKPAAMRLVHPVMSKTHCVLYWHEGQLWVVDLLSPYRTMLDGVSLTAGRVQPGQVIGFGNVLLTFLDRRTAVNAERPTKIESSGDNACATLEDVPEAEPVGDSDRNGAQHMGTERSTLSVTRLEAEDPVSLPAGRMSTPPTDATPALAELQQQLLAAQRDRDELIEQRRAWLELEQQRDDLQEQSRLKEADLQHERTQWEARLGAIQQKLDFQQREWQMSQRAQSALQAQYDEAVQTLEKQAHADSRQQGRLREFEAAQDAWQAEQASLLARLTKSETRERALAAEQKGEAATAMARPECSRFEAQIEELRGELDQGQKRETTLRTSLAEANAREAALASEAHRHEERAATEVEHRQQLQQRLEEGQAEVSAAEERQRKLELALAESERQIIAWKQAQANRDTEHAAALQAALAGAQAGKEFEARLQEVQSARAQDWQRQAELESRLKHYEESAANGNVRRQEIAPNAEHLGLLEHQAVLEMPPLEIVPRFAPVLPAKSAVPTNGRMLIEAPIALPPVKRTPIESEAGPPVAADQDDDLVNRLMMYQSRSMAARRRRLVIVSIGVVATAVLVAGAMAWQSLSPLWSDG